MSRGNLQLQITQFNFLTSNIQSSHNGASIKYIGDRSPKKKISTTTYFRQEAVPGAAQMLTSSPWRCGRVPRIQLLGLSRETHMSLRIHRPGFHLHVLVL